MRDPAACASLGAAIRAQREQQGMSRADLSRASGLHRTTIARIERGLSNPRYHTINALGRGLGSLTEVFARMEADERRAD